MIVWIYLLLAIATEVAGTLALPHADGFSQPLPSAIVVAGYALSILFLALTVRGLDLGLVYAVWAGLGTAAIAAIGMLALGEPASAPKVACVALIVAGVVGLNLAGAH